MTAMGLLLLLLLLLLLQQPSGGQQAGDNYVVPALGAGCQGTAEFLGCLCVRRR